jgi:hypothetical protein
VAPGDRVADGALAGRKVARTAGQHAQRGVEAGQQRVGREDAGPGRGELNGQGEAVQTRTIAATEPALPSERVNDGSAARARWANSSTPGWPQGCRGCPGCLVRGPAAGRPGTPARRTAAAARGWWRAHEGQDRRPAAGDERARRPGPARVVEDQEQPPVYEVRAEAVGEGGVPGLADAEGGGEGGRDERRVADRGQVDEGGAVGEVGAELRSDGERQARLANAAGAVRLTSRTPWSRSRVATAAISSDRPTSGVGGAGRRGRGIGSASSAPMAALTGSVPPDDGERPSGRQPASDRGRGTRE